MTIQISCPQCSVDFKLPESAVRPGGRRVRCSNCGNLWVYRAPADVPPAAAMESQPADAPAFLNQPLPTDKPASFGQALRQATGKGTMVEPSRKPFWRTDRAGLIGYAAAAVVFLGVLFGLNAARDQVVALYPGSAHIYALLGAAPVETKPPLQFQRTSIGMEDSKGGRRLFVRGEILNTAQTGHPVPPVRVKVKGEDDKMLGGWVFGVGMPNVEPGKAVAFESAQPLKAAGKLAAVELSFVVGN